MTIIGGPYVYEDTELQVGRGRITRSTGTVRVPYTLYNVHYYRSAAV
jgi:hypothetical protein